LNDQEQDSKYEQKCAEDRRQKDESRAENREAQPEGREIRDAIDVGGAAGQSSQHVIQGQISGTAKHKR
jgi:hypothetical protein